MEFGPPTLPGLFRRRMGLVREVDVIRMDSADNRYLREAIDRSREVVYGSTA